jgi:hypothetical protein
MIIDRDRKLSHLIEGIGGGVGNEIGNDLSEDGWVINLTSGN